MLGGHVQNLLLMVPPGICQRHFLVNLMVQIVAITIGITVCSFAAVQFNVSFGLCEQHNWLQNAAVRNVQRDRAQDHM